MRTTHPRLPWRLTALLLAGAPALAHADEPTWVFFADRGRADDELAAAVTARAAELAPRALDRRQRARRDRGVDGRDLAPTPAHVAAVLATGARLRSTSRWLNAVSVDADADQRAEIAALSAVARVQPVARHLRRTAAAPDLISGPRMAAGDDDDGVAGVAHDQLELLHIPALHACGFTGAGVVVGVQDSGFSLEHAALTGVHVIAARDFLNGDDIVADEPGDPEGQHDHGTMILSLLAGNDPGRYMGAAPGVSVILAKTEDSSVEEPFEEDRFVEGLEWIESMGADMFTTSLGYTDWYTQGDFDGHTAVTTKAAVIALEQGLILFGSVGNAGPGPRTLLAPSDADGLIAVGAIDPDGLVAEFSSRGPTADGRIKPDIAAPGQNIWVADPGSPDHYGHGNGTSLATPLAAGAAALLLEAFPDLDPAAMRDLLRQSATLADAPNNDLGWGVPDIGRSLTPLCPGDDTTGDHDPSTGDPDPSTGDHDPSTGDPDPSTGDKGEDDSAASTGDMPADPLGDDTGDDGCGCAQTRTTWPTALVLPWLMIRRRRTTRDTA